MKTLFNTVLEVRPQDFINLSDKAKNGYITCAVIANIQWINFIKQNESDSINLVDHDYFGNCLIENNQNEFVISFSKWGYKEPQYFDSKLFVKKNDYFGMLRSLLYRVSPNENIQGNFFHSFIEFNKSMSSQINEENNLSEQQALDFLNLCQANEDNYQITEHWCGTKSNFWIATA